MKEIFPLNNEMRIRLLYSDMSENDKNDDILDIKRFFSTVSMNDLLRQRNIGIKKATEIIEWVGGIMPAPQSKKRCWCFHIFRKKIRITLTIKNQ